MKRFFNFFILVSFISYYASCRPNIKETSATVTYTTGENFNYISNFKQCIYVDKNEHDDIKRSSIEDINLRSNLYFYKSNTKVAKYFRHGLSNYDNIFFEYNGGNLVFLNKYKEGFISKISDLYHNSIAEEKSDNESGMYVNNEPFSILNPDVKVNEYTPISYAAICELKSNNFLPTKYICYSSDDGGINAFFSKDGEYKALHKSMNSYMYEDNPHLINQISRYFKNSFGMYFDATDFVYYIFNKTILCNLDYLFSRSISYLIVEEERIRNDLYLLTNEYISYQNNQLLNSDSNSSNFYNYIIWKHKNKNLTEQNFENCNTFYVDQDEIVSYIDNKNFLYEVSLYNNENLFNIEDMKNIKSISSVNEYIAFFYHNDENVIILNNYKLYMHFQLENVLDLVLFQYKYNEVGFYYVASGEYKRNLGIYKCILNAGNVICEQISCVPYEISLEKENVYITTVQKKDISAIFISTHNKVWKIYKEKKGIYKRRLINSITNNDEFFGHINCYTVETIYQNKLFDKAQINIINYEENTYGCSYLKHITNSENSLLISFIKNEQITQYTYHIVKNINFILSYGTTYVTVDLTASYYILIIFCIISTMIALYAIYKIILFSKRKIGGVDNHIFDSYEKESCASTIG